MGKMAKEIVKMKSTRAAYGEILLELGERYPDLLVMDADLGKSTQTINFGKKYPDRFFDAGIAEQNMIGVASGLSKTGKTVIVSTLAVFAPGRCWDQVRNTLAHSNCNVKIVTSHAGISIGKDGSSHQALEDIALWRVIPGIRVIVPCDAIETKKAIQVVVKEPGPFAVRLGRPEVPYITSPGREFKIGKGYIMREGRDLTLVACGMMVHECLKAVEILKKDGINARIVDMPTVKPIDRNLLINCARETGYIFPCEEHSIIGGFGSAVLEVLEEERGCYVKRIGTQDCWGESGEPQELFEKYGLSASKIVKTVKESIYK